MINYNYNYNLIINTIDKLNFKYLNILFILNVNNINYQVI